MAEKTYGGAYKGIAITIWILGTIGSFSLGDTLKEAWYSNYNYTACIIGLFSTLIFGSLFYAIGIGLNYLGQCRDLLKNFSDKREDDGQTYSGNEEQTISEIIPKKDESTIV